MITTLKALLAAFAVSITITAAAAPHLVPIANSFLAPAASSNPGAFQQIGNSFYFVTARAPYGIDVWTSDGTVPGTKKISAASPTVWTPLQRLGNAALFTLLEDPVSGNNGIWRTDGTAAGTYRILAAAANETQSFLISADTRAFLMLPKQSYVNYTSEIRVSDGTAGTGTVVGTYPALPPTAGSVAGAAGKLFFIGEDSSIGRQLWVSDGTALGTHLVRRGFECPVVPCGLTPTTLVRVGQAVFFTTEQGLWRTDGTDEGTVQIAALKDFAVLAHSDRYLYLRVSSGSTTATLWCYDTATGAIRAGEPYDRIAEQTTVLADGRLVSFLTADGGEGFTISVSDGSIGSTRSLGSFKRDYYSSYQPLVGVLGTTIFFQGSSATTGTELWSVGVDSGTPSALVKDIDPRRTDGVQSGKPGIGGAFGNRLFFAAQDLNGRELWETDGTAAGTKLFMNIAPDPGGGAVSGTVRDKATNAPVANVAVLLCNATQRCETWTYTGADGTYRFDSVIPADYRVVTSADAVYLGADLGQVVTVRSGLELAGTDLLLTRGGIITGTVTKSTDGTPQQAEIIVRNANGVVVADVTSDFFTGEYRTAALASGNYTLIADTRFSYGQLTGQTYNGKDCDDVLCTSPAGDRVAVTTGATTANINFPLHGFGRIAGTVRDANAQPVPSVQVSLFRTNDISSYVDVVTDANGHYVSPLIRPGTYTVRSNGSAGYANASYIQGCTANCTGTPTPVTVKADGTTNDIDLVKSRTNGSVLGVLRERTGKVLPGMTVLLVGSTNLYSAPTASDGRFALANVPPGRYYLRVDQRYYGSGDCLATTCATPIDITDANYATVNFTLQMQLTTISGRIFDAATGNPIANASAYLVDGHATASSLNEVRNDGTYTFHFLSPDTEFKVQAAAAGYHTQNYRDVAADCVNNCPAPTLVPAGTATGIDFALRRWGAITGTVVNAVTSEPVKDALIFITAGGTDVGMTRSDENGRYRWQGANGGSYNVSASAGYDAKNYDPQAYPNVDCDTGGVYATRCPIGSGSTVIAPDGVDTSGINFRLRPRILYGKITGRVVDDETGLPVAGIEIWTRDANGYAHDAHTDANGYYTLFASSYNAGLATGRYYVLASVPPPYLTALFGGKVCFDRTRCDATQGTPVDVQGPYTTTDVNFRLVKVRLTSISPSRGLVTGGTRVTLTGRNFAPDATVMIGANAATIVSVTPTTIVADTPAGTAGYAHVSLLNSPTSYYLTLVQAFFYSTTAVSTRSDFDGDGKADMLWINSATGDTWGWLMNGAKLAKSAQITTITPSYQLQGIGDFDRDGKSDLVWLGPQGDAWIWLMNGLSIKSSSSPYTVAPNFRVAGIGDFDGDGQSDLLWFNAVTGDTYLWLMNGSAIGSSRLVTTVAPNYRVSGVGDFDGDGKSDILWFNATTGDTYLWLMNGQTIRSSSYIYTAAPNYAITGVGDFDGDGKSDLLWFNNVTGDTYIWLMSGATIAKSSFIYQVANNFRIAGVGDFDGDAKSDLVWRNTSTGDTYVWLMNGTQFTSSTFIYAPTTQWTVPAPGAF